MFLGQSLLESRILRPLNANGWRPTNECNLRRTQRPRAGGEARERQILYTAMAGVGGRTREPKHILSYSLWCKHDVKVNGFSYASFSMDGPDQLDMKLLYDCRHSD